MEKELHHQPATPEEIRAILHRVAKAQEKSAEEWENIRKLFKENEQRQKETDRQMKETDRQMKETDRRAEKRMKALEGMFTSQWGKLMESLVEGDLVSLLQARGVDIKATYPYGVKGRLNGEHYQFDILVGNGTELVVVEVKTTLRVKHVKQFLAKLSRFTEYRPVYRNNQVYGAMAYLRAEQEAEVYAQRQGLFVIRATGSSASIINEADFRPRRFS